MKLRAGVIAVAVAFSTHAAYANDVCDAALLGDFASESTTISDEVKKDTFRQGACAMSSEQVKTAMSRGGGVSWMQIGLSVSMTDAQFKSWHQQHCSARSVAEHRSSFQFNAQRNVPYPAMAEAWLNCKRQSSGLYCWPELKGNVVQLGLQNTLKGRPPVKVKDSYIDGAQSVRSDSPGILIAAGATISPGNTNIPLVRDPKRDVVGHINFDINGDGEVCKVFIPRYVAPPPPPVRSPPFLAVLPDSGISELRHVETGQAICVDNQLPPEAGANSTPLRTAGGIWRDSRSPYRPNFIETDPGNLAGRLQNGQCAGVLVLSVQSSRRFRDDSIALELKSHFVDLRRPAPSASPPPLARDPALRAPPQSGPFPRPGGQDPGPAREGGRVPDGHPGGFPRPGSASPPPGQR